MNHILHKYYITVETLTPIHIGSGRELMGNFEYLFFKKDRKIALIDEQKVLNLIGTDQIDKWVSIIDQGGNLLHYLLQRKRNLLPEDVSQRIMSVPDQGPVHGNHGQTILEQLHNGTGKPILPGSSLKGALRTAIFTKLVLEYDSPQRILQKTYEKKCNTKLNREKYIFKDKELEKNLIGKNANQDTFRMLRTGDMHFTYTEVFPTNTVNKKHNGWMMDSKISPYLECIPSGQKTLCELSIIKDKTILNCFSHIPFKTWKELCAIVNDHTRRLLKDELAFWESEYNPPLIATYLEHLQKLLKQIPEDHEACLLRIGYGSGVNFITGGWQSEIMDDDLYERWRGSFHKSRSGMPFPKTRKMTSDSRPLGFVLLRRIDKNQLSIYRESMLTSQPKPATEAIEVQKAEKIIPKEIEAEFLKEHEKLKQGTLLDAYVYPENKGKQKRIKLYLHPGKHQEVELTYPSDIILGKIIQVSVSSVKNKTIQHVKFKRFKK